MILLMLRKSSKQPCSLPHHIWPPPVQWCSTIIIYRIALTSKVIHISKSSALTSGKRDMTCNYIVLILGFVMDVCIIILCSVFHSSSMPILYKPSVCPAKSHVTLMITKAQYMTSNFRNTPAGYSADKSSEQIIMPISSLTQFSYSTTCNSKTIL